MGMVIFILGIYVVFGVVSVSVYVIVDLFTCIYLTRDFPCEYISMLSYTLYIYDVSTRVCDAFPIYTCFSYIFVI